MSNTSAPAQHLEDDNLPEQAEQSESGSINLEELARMVLKLLKEELWIESERRAWH